MRFFGIVLGLVAGVALHGCGGDDDTTSAPTPAPASASAPKVKILQEEAKELIDAAAVGSLVGTEGQFIFTEGPVWEPQSGTWIFSDLVGSIQYQYKPGGSVEVFRDGSHKANGNFLLSDDILLTAEHGTNSSSPEGEGGRALYQVTVSSLDREELTSTYQNKKLTGPNDVVVRKKTGSIYFTDPSYATNWDYGHGLPTEQDTNRVFRLDKLDDGSGGYVTEPVSVEEGLSEPNGITFNPDETKAYVSDSDDTVHKIYVFDVDDAGDFSNKEIFASVAEEIPDGIRCDHRGNLWSSSHQGVNVYSPDGIMIAQIQTPGIVTNLAFGGADGQDLMLTAATSVWIIKTKVRAAWAGTPPGSSMVQV